VATAIRAVRSAQSRSATVALRRALPWLGAAALSMLPVQAGLGQQVAQRAVLAAEAPEAAAEAAEPAPEIGAWYTDAQADRGQRNYPTTCGGCHGTNMIELFSLYEDAGRYFRFVTGSMPADDPGSLPIGDYLDIMAYLMREIGFPAGPDELKGDRTLLAQIKPKASRDILDYAPYDEQYDPGYESPIGRQP